MSRHRVVVRPFPPGPLRQRERSTAWRAIFIPGVILLAAAILAGSLYPILEGSADALGKFNATFLAKQDEKYPIGRFPERSTIYADDGSVLATVADYNRSNVALEDVAPIAREAVLAIEDDSFYKHGAVNLLSILRAAIANLRAGKVVQGGSTLTLQLVGTTYSGGDTDLARKIQEAQDAIRLERTYTKDEILERYLNQVYFGNGTYGIEAAAEFYFGRTAAELKLHQAALLAGLIKAPATYDPIKFPEAARARRDIVLLRMKALGQRDPGQWITEEQYESAIAKPIKLSSRNRNVNDYGTTSTAYFTRYVIDRILDENDRRYSRALGDTEEDRSRALFQGGLKIYTTVRPVWQQYAARAVEDQLPRQGPAPPADPQAAMVSIVPQSGAIKAMYGGTDFSKQKINLATQSRRQAGSAFKAFTLVGALEQGTPVGKVYTSKSPITIPQEKCPNPGEDWTPENAESGTGGFMNMRAATANSVNTWFAQLIADVGPEPVVDAARRMGVRGPSVSIPPVCSITLGSVEVNPLAMTTGFATLANQGNYCQPYAITRIESRTGRRLYQAKPSCKQVVDPQIAATVTDLMEGVVREGTGTAANIGRPQAGKTGTAFENKDAWFMGYIPQLCTGVWVGYSKKAYPMDSLRVLGGLPAFGGRIAAPIWHDFMINAVRRMPILDFPPPPAEKAGTVPNVVGLMQAEAIDVLAKANFTPFVQTVDSAEPAGTVVGQTPAGGATATLGSIVTIQVSNGTAPTTTVPNVVGSTSEEAQATLKGAGFKVEVVYRTVKDPSLDGIVLGQDPKGGTDATAGSTVGILVGQLEPEPSPSPSPTP